MIEVVLKECEEREQEELKRKHIEDFKTFIEDIATNLSNKVGYKGKVFIRTRKEMKSSGEGWVDWSYPETQYHIRQKKGILSSRVLVVGSLDYIVGPHSSFDAYTPEAVNAIKETAQREDYGLFEKVIIVKKFN